MQNTQKPNPTFDPDSAPQNSSSRPTSPQVPVKGYPGQKAEGTTVKNPKTPETTKETKVEEVANKAAHKAAKDEQEHDKKNSIISI
jgi:hypothetical protein